jgi:hypothetical protein
MTAPVVMTPLESFLHVCDRLKIANQAARHAVLTAATSVGCHEHVLFFLCGRDFIYNPTDLKAEGIQKLFVGEETPFAINVSDAAPAAIRRQMYATSLNVHTETGEPHTYTSFRRAPGVRPGGVGNYNLCTQALIEAREGLRGTFLRDLITQVTAAVTNGSDAVSASKVSRMMQNMRNATRPFWIYDMPEIGL